MNFFLDKQRLVLWERVSIRPPPTGATISRTPSQGSHQGREPVERWHQVIVVTTELGSPATKTLPCGIVPPGGVERVTSSAVLAETKFWQGGKAHPCTLTVAPSKLRSYGSTASVGSTEDEVGRGVYISVPSLEHPRTTNTCHAHPALPSCLSFQPQTLPFLVDQLLACYFIPALPSKL